MTMLLALQHEMTEMKNRNADKMQTLRQENEDIKIKLYSEHLSIRISY